MLPQLPSASAFLRPAAPSIISRVGVHRCTLSAESDCSAPGGNTTPHPCGSSARTAPFSSSQSASTRLVTKWGVSVRCAPTARWMSRTTAAMRGQAAGRSA
eukprot:687645-Rhodomonas_salina.3